MWGLGGVKKNQNQTKPPRVEAEEPRRGITTRGGPHPTDLANTLPPWSSSGDHLQRTKRTEIGRYTLQTPPSTPVNLLPTTIFKIWQMRLLTCNHSCRKQMYTLISNRVKPLPKKKKKSLFWYSHIEGFFPNLPSDDARIWGILELSVVQ